MRICLSAVFMDTTMMADAKPETTKGITFEGKHLKYSRVNQNQSIYYRCPGVVKGCPYAVTVYPGGVIKKSKKANTELIEDFY